MDTTKPDFGTLNTLSAFDHNTVGTKVTDPRKFYKFLTVAVATHDTSKDKATGQHFLILPKEAFSTVTAGVGRRSKEPRDYVPRLHRDTVELYLKRDFAAAVESLSVVVYTRQAYLADPDINPDKVAERFPGNEEKLADAIKETKRIEGSSFTHIVVAVLASAGPRAPLSPIRLVNNLAGGNNEVNEWSKEDIVMKAQLTKAYYDEWCTVAD